jgi:predicted Zn finger-like uncharacterized protein
MDVACQSCSAMYPISDQKIAGRVVRFRCKRCGTPILVDGRQQDAAASSRHPSAPASGGLPPSVPPPSSVSVSSVSASSVSASSVSASSVSASSVSSSRRPSSLPPGAPPLPPEVFAPGYGQAAPTVGSVPPSSHQSFGEAPFDAKATAPVVQLTRPTSVGVPLGSPPAAPVSGKSGHAAPRLPRREGNAVPAQVVSSAPLANAVVASASPAAAPRPSAATGWDVDVDPSMYEDETVAMTATELEAAADAKAPPTSSAPAPFPLRSQPPPKPWPPPPPSSPPLAPRGPQPGASASPSSSNGPSAPPGVFGLTPPPPVASAFTSAHPGLGASFPSGDVQRQQSAPPPPTGPVFPSVPPFPPQPVVATRAESWAIGQEPFGSPAIGSPALGSYEPPPAPTSFSSNRNARTWTSLEPQEPPRKENKWVFPLLLVALGLGGLVLGGVLGKTYIAHLLNPGSKPNGAAVEFDPSLPPFAPLEANELLEKAQNEAVHCLNADTTPLTGLLVARFNPNGALDQLQMSGTLGSAPETPCVRSVFEKVRVAAFGGPPAQVEKAIELRPQP